jgi:clan AA aspartic protease
LEIFLRFEVKLINMGLTYADIELINAGDIAMARKFVIGDDEIKRMNINILVDTGAYNLCINETIQEQLDLPFLEKRKGQLVPPISGRSIEEYDLVGPIVLKFKNRQTVCNALVLKGENKPLLGAIPLEDLDVIIHPLSQQLMVNPDHPNYAQMKLK